MMSSELFGTIVVGLIVGLIGFLAGKVQRGFSAEITQKIESDIRKLELEVNKVSNDLHHLGRNFDELKRDFREFRGGQIRITRLPGESPDAHRPE